MIHYHFYNYILPLESIIIHYNIPEPPYIEYTFSNNLTLINPISTYNWLPYDNINDPFPVQQQRIGLLSLNNNINNPLPNLNNYINLNSLSGPNSLYTNWPIIGGSASLGNGLTNIQYGWTIEIIFKSSRLYILNSNIYDLGTGSSLDTISLGFSGNTSTIQFILNNNAGYTTVLPVIQPLTVNTWYSVVVTMTPSGSTATATQGTTTVYVNGYAVGQPTFGAYPLAVARPAAYLGHSSSGGNSFVGMIDAFRIYDYSMSQAQVTQLSTASNLNSPVQFVPVSSTGVSSSGGGGGGGGGGGSSSSSSSSSTGATPSSGSSSLSSGAIAGIVVGGVGLFTLYSRINYSSLMPRCEPEEAGNV